MNFGYYPYQNGSPSTYQQQLMQMQQQQQNNNFIHVPSEEVARNYSVAPGGSATFINDNAPYCYTKTAGFSQFDAPVFRKFRLVEETANGEPIQQEEPQKSGITVESLSEEVKSLYSRVEALEAMLNNQPKTETIQAQHAERRNKNEPSKQQH